jgi:uncharacterized protein YndB with AHSA1/START domain
MNARVLIAPSLTIPALLALGLLTPAAQDAKAPVAAPASTTAPAADTAAADDAAYIGRAIRYRVDVPAPIEQVWAAWTEPARIREWFARGAHVELKALGRYEILFSPDAPPGSRGAEGNLVLAVQAPQMLSFTWDAPPHLPLARAQRTSVVLHLQALAPDSTRVWFAQTGWGQGGEWDAAFDYFTGAWTSVLALLHHRFAVGPIDWTAGVGEETLAGHAGHVSAW